MDTLIYPPAAPIPLILPRSLSFQAGSSSDLHKGSSRGRKSSFTTEPVSSSSSSPATSPISIGTSNHEQQQQHALRRQSSFTFPASTSLPATYTFLPSSTSFSSNSSKNNSSTTTMVRSQIRRQRRRHTVTGGGFTWTTTTTLPPRHALHMPVMKISPLVRRKEQHQRNIHRLMHEGREVEVMRRRGVATVMDTSEEGDEEDEEGGMAGVVFTGASIQQVQSALNEHAQMQAKREFAMLVAESSKTYQGILHQQQLQLQQQRAAAAEEEQRRRNSWPKQQLTTTEAGAIAYANMPMTFQQQQQQQQQHQQAYLQEQAQQQQKLIQLQQQHQHQLQFQQQKDILLQQQQQQQQLQLQNQQQQLYKQRIYASSNPTLNKLSEFPSPPRPQVQWQQAQQQQQVPQIQTPQQRGANALSFAKTLNQNNAATTASNWSYAPHHATSTGRLSLC